jgi:hypothetical protein
MAAFDFYIANGSEPGPTANDAAVVTPSDSTDLAFVTRWIRANVAGTIKLTTKNGSTVTLNFAAGETRAIRASRIWATGTTATGIEALW